MALRAGGRGGCLIRISCNENPVIRVQAVRCAILGAQGCNFLLVHTQQLRSPTSAHVARSTVFGMLGKAVLVCLTWGPDTAAMALQGGERGNGSQEECEDHEDGALHCGWLEKNVQKKLAFTPGLWVCKLRNYVIIEIARCHVDRQSVDGTEAICIVLFFIIIFTLFYLVQITIGSV